MTQGCRRRMREIPQGRLELHMFVYFLHLVLAQLLPVLAGGHADDLAEGAEKV